MSVPILLFFKNSDCHFSYLTFLACPEREKKLTKLVKLTNFPFL